MWWGKTRRGHRGGTYPRDAAGVPRVRRQVRQALGGCDRLHDALVVASELATIAVQDGSGDEYRVTVGHVDGHVLVEVGDGGGVGPGADGDRLGVAGCRMALVAGLANEFGSRGTPGVRVLWARITCGHP